MRTIPSVFCFLFILCAECFTAAAGAANFSGTWATIWNDGKRTALTMYQGDGKVAGNYTHANGKIAGIVDGNVLTGNWSQSDGSKGQFRFVLTADGTSFRGRWKNAGARNWQGTWHGKLQ